MPTLSMYFINTLLVTSGFILLIFAVAGQFNWAILVAGSNCSDEYNDSDVPNNPAVRS